MAHVDTLALPPVGQVGFAHATTTRKKQGLLQCLIVSPSVARQQMLAAAAVQGGWDPVICPDAESALAAMGVVVMQLALVDLEGTDPLTYRRLLEKLAINNGLLLVVCGNEGDAQEEIAVRQLGAWLYLPGVADGESVSMLCGEARQITERLQARNKPSASRQRGSGGAGNRYR